MTKVVTRWGYGAQRILGMFTIVTGDFLEPGEVMHLSNERCISHVPWLWLLALKRTRCSLHIMDYLKRVEREATIENDIIDIVQQAHGSRAARVARWIITL